MASRLNRAGGNCADITFEAIFSYSHSSSTGTALFLVEYYVMGDDGSYPETPSRMRMDSMPNALEGINYAIPERYIGKVGLTGKFDFSFLEPGSGDGDLGIDPIEGFVADRYVLDESLTTMLALYQPGEMLAFKVYLAKRLGIRFEAGAHGELLLEGTEDAAIAGPDAIEYHLLRGADFPQVPAVKPSVGYAFTGWKAGSGDASEFFKGPIERSLTATACYEAQEATIVFETNGGAAVEPLVGVTDAAVPSALPIPVRDGYTLQGWYDNQELTGEPLAALPETFAPGVVTYYAQWKLDVRGLSAEAFSSKGAYTGRDQGIALPASLKMKDGETLTLLDADGRYVANPSNFAREVADSAEDLAVVICDAAGTELARFGGVYDGLEHAVTYEIAPEEAQKATISFEGPTSYTNAGSRTITYDFDNYLTGKVEEKTSQATRVAHRA